MHHWELVIEGDPDMQRHQRLVIAIDQDLQQHQVMPANVGRRTGAGSTPDLAAPARRDCYDALPWATKP